MKFPSPSPPHTHTYAYMVNIFLCSCDLLLPLSALVNLNSLTLQLVLYTVTPPLELSNPVCLDPSYHKTMAEYLPNLQWLDGEEVSPGEPGSAFYKEVRDIKMAQCHGGDADASEQGKGSPDSSKCAYVCTCTHLPHSVVTDENELPKIGKSLIHCVEWQEGL